MGCEYNVEDYIITTKSTILLGLENVPKPSIFPLYYYYASSKSSEQYDGVAIVCVDENGDARIVDITADMKSETTIFSYSSSGKYISYNPFRRKVWYPSILTRTKV